MSKVNVKIGGFDNYSIRSATLVEGWFPGAGRMNLLQDPDLALGQVDFGTFWADDMIMDGPGTILQALPDASKFQYERIFAVPHGNPYRDFGVDDRQIAGYQVEQLNNNPLSQYTTNPNGLIPGFDCLEEPDNYSNMVNKREDEFKKYFESDYANDWLQGTTGGQNVYHQTKGKRVNSNAEVVYNLSMDYKGDVNPMISLGSSNVAASQKNFSGLCYSNPFVPGQTIGSEGGGNQPQVYGNNLIEKNFQGAVGFMNNQAYKSNTICEPTRELSYINPLILENNNIA